MKITFRILSFLGLLNLSVPGFAQGVNLAQLEQELRTTGAVGYIHGAVAGASQAVFSYRGSGGFFDTEHFPLISRDPSVKKILLARKRHDKIRIWGSIKENESPLKHLAVTKVEILDEYPAISPNPYSYQPDIEQKLLNNNELLALVHAVGKAGKVLVLEFEDAILPLPVERTELTKNLYRNDAVWIRYEIQEHPGRPIHINIDPRAPKPLERLFEVAKLHNQPVVREGRLVKFPKSPQVQFDVFALEWNLVVEREDQLKSYSVFHTLVNVENPDTFTAIRRKLGDAWDQAHPGNSGTLNGRNKLISPTLRVRAAGTYNMIDPGQANPQILLSSPSDIEIR